MIVRSVLVSDSGGTRVKMSLGLLPIQVSSGVGSGLEIKIQGSSEPEGMGGGEIPQGECW